MVQGVLMAGEFGRKLKSLRERAGLTQEGLARASNLSTSAVAKLEQRDLDPSWSTVQALAKALGISCEAFASDGSEAEGEAAQKPAPKKPKR